MNSVDHKALAWLTRAPKTPPIGEEARRELGFLLRELQKGRTIPPPDSKPMASIGRRVHELRVDDTEMRTSWRLVYRVDSDAIVVAHWFEKRSQKTPKHEIDTAKQRLASYDQRAPRGKHGA